MCDIWVFPNIYSPGLKGPGRVRSQASDQLLSSSIPIYLYSNIQSILWGGGGPKPSQPDRSPMSPVRLRHLKNVEKTWQKQTFTVLKPHEPQRCSQMNHDDATMTYHDPILIQNALT